MTRFLLVCPENLPIRIIGKPLLYTELSPCKPFEKSDQISCPLIPVSTFKNLTCFDRPWIPAFPFKNLDRFARPWIFVSPLKNWPSSTIRGSLRTFTKKIGPNRRSVDPCIPFINFGPNLPDMTVRGSQAGDSQHTFLTKSDQISGPLIPVSSFKNLDRSDRPWVSAYVFQKSDQIWTGSPVRRSLQSFLKNWSDSAVHGSIHPPLKIRTGLRFVDRPWISN